MASVKDVARSGLPYNDPWNGTSNPGEPLPGKHREARRVEGEKAMRLMRFAPALAAGLLILSGLRAGPLPADGKVQATVEKQLTRWWLKPEERRFDQIAWAADLRAARKLAAKHGRPVFLFTMDGRVNLGRC
jgi:hypothetical protein